MAVAALITWLITAAFGAWMLSIWIGRGGNQRSDGGAPSHLPAARVFSHFGLAVLGLILWIIYLVVDKSIIAWIAFADLVLIALLGSLLVARWSKDRRTAPATSAGPAAATTSPAEQHIPLAAVALHGVFAVTTFVLVLIVAVSG
jgi:hypothetical protein